MISPQLLTRLLPLMGGRPSARTVRLSQRDRDLLLLISEGLSNAEIAERTAVDVSPVELHVAALSAKLGAHSRLEALSMACRQGLLPRAVE